MSPEMERVLDEAVRCGRIDTDGARLIRLAFIVLERAVLSADAVVELVEDVNEPGGRERALAWLEAAQAL
jgi:hypothetical protein